MSDQYIQDRLLRHKIRILRLSKGMSNEINKKLNKFSKKISKLIKKNPSKPLTSKQLSVLLEEINRGIAELKIGTEIIEEVREFVKLEVEYMEALLKQSIETTTITKTATESIFAVVSEKPMRLVPYKLGAPAPTFTIKEVIENFEKKVSKDNLLIIRNGFIQGEPSEVTARKIDQLTRRRTRRQAEALTRTVYNHMGAEARGLVTKANRDYFEGEEYVATLDSRTTIICAGYDGAIFAIDKGPHPPMHWNCRSLRSPKVKEEYKIPGLEGERPAVSLNKDKTRKISTVSSETKYSGWLRRQPKHFQEEVLGKKRAELFRNGEVKLENFTDQQGTIIPLRALRGKDGMPIID